MTSNVIFNKIAVMNRVTGDIAYGSAWTVKKVQKMTDNVLLAADGDEAKAIAILEAATNFFGTKVD